MTHSKTWEREDLYLATITRSESTLFMMSDMIYGLRADSLLRVISQHHQRTVSIPVLLPYNLYMLLGEFNRLKVEAADVGNAYLEAYTKEKVYVIAGPEFGEERQGHAMVIVKALYGLRTSSARFHEKFADTLLSMNFLPCKADPDVWMRDCDTHYEYVCMYVDDLAVMMKDPSLFFAELKVRKYKLKGVGEIISFWWRFLP
jgi:hypothetical protein